MSIWDRIKYEFSQKASPVRKLIIINVAIFVVSWLVMAMARYMQSTGQAAATAIDILSAAVV